MKKTNKLIIVLVSILTLLLVWGCGSSVTNSNPSQEQDSNSNSQNAQDSNVIKIGIALALSGAGSAFGEAGKAGAELAAKKINENGGILNGRKIRLIFADDKGTPEGGVQAYNRLIDVDKVDVVAGTSHSSVAIAVKEVTRDKILHLIIGAQADAITDEGHKWLFNLSGKSTENARAFTDYINERFAGKKVVILAEQTDYGRDNVSTLEKAWTGGENAELVAVEYFDPKATNFTGPITKLLANKPDLFVLVNAFPVQSATIFQQLYQAGYTGAKAMSVGVFNNDVIALAGDKAVENVTSGDVWHQDVDHEENREFVKLFEEEYGTRPGNIMAAYGYDGVNVLAQAIELAGNPRDYDKLAQVMHENEFKGVLGDGKIMFDEKGRNHPTVYFFDVKGGKTVLNGIKVEQR